DLRGEEVFVSQEIPLKEPIVDVAQVTTVGEVNVASNATTNSAIATTITIDDITLAKALEAIKTFVRSCTSERAEVYYECKEPFKSLKSLWVRSKSIAATWLEKVVTPLIEPAIKGFITASAILKLERLKVDKHVCEGSSTSEDYVLVKEKQERDKIKTELDKNEK
nr:hypothetical protein [Tanacetum cinerariifolium]